MVVYLTTAMDYGSSSSRITDTAGSSKLIRGNERLAQGEVWMTANWLSAWTTGTMYFKWEAEPSRNRSARWKNEVFRLSSSLSYRVIPCSIWKMRGNVQLQRQRSLGRSYVAGVCLWNARGVVCRTT